MPPPEPGEAMLPVKLQPLTKGEEALFAMPPPPLLVAVLSLNVQPSTTAFEPLILVIPPPNGARFEANELSVTVGEEPKLQMAPPPEPAFEMLFENSQSVISALEELTLYMAPPDCAAVLSEKVQPAITGEEASFRIAPPW